MNNQQAYNHWAETYNDMVNKTRDLELHAKQETLRAIEYATVLELGCGTGKNTQWLLQKASAITAVDFSESMMAKAKEKVNSAKVNFVQADINGDWDFITNPVDLVTCSLVLEHIEHLNPVFEKASAALTTAGHFYIGELHPFKQYSGTKARFDNGHKTLTLDCYVHHISVYTTVAARNGLELMSLNEWFDAGDALPPRILTLLFRKT